MPTSNLTDIQKTSTGLRKYHRERLPHNPTDQLGTVSSREFRVVPSALGDDFTMIRLFAMGNCVRARLSASRLRTRASIGSNVGDNVAALPTA